MSKSIIFLMDLVDSGFTEALPDLSRELERRLATHEITYQLYLIIRKEYLDDVDR